MAERIKQSQTEQFDLVLHYLLWNLRLNTHGKYGMHGSWFNFSYTLVQYIYFHSSKIIAVLDRQLTMCILRAFKTKTGHTHFVSQC